MGRPSLTRRPTRSQEKGSNQPDSPEVFPRRNPRVGSQFQHKFPKAATATCEQPTLALLDRPKPLAWSRHVPFRTELEVKNGHLHEEAARDVESMEKSTGSSPWFAAVAGYETSSEPVLLHSPNPHVDDWLSYCRPIFAPRAWKEDDDDDATDHNNKDDDLLVWYRQTQDPDSGGRNSRKSRYKRPRTAASSLPACFVNAIMPNKKRAKQMDDVHFEVDENILRGAVVFRTMTTTTLAQAQWSHLVQLSQGMAASAFRAKRKNDKASSSSWRDRWIESLPGLQGDYRADPAPRYPLVMATTQTLVVSAAARSANERNRKKEEEEEEEGDVWMVLLACGHVLEEQIAERSVTLSTLATFLYRACRVPTPQKSLPQAVADQADQCLTHLVTVGLEARKRRAQLLDLWAEDGIDVESLRKQLDHTAKSSPVVLDEVAELNRQVDVVFDWQNRLDDIFNDESDDPNRNDLETLHLMRVEGLGHGFRCKGVSILESRYEKAQQFRERILAWKMACEQNVLEPIKFVTALVREVERLRVRYPLVSELLAIHREAESWVDRANVAIRSRITLAEIKDLIDKGAAMPLDLSEFLEKLNARVVSSEDWLRRFAVAVGCTLDIDAVDCMRLIRNRLNEGDYNALHELAVDGGRVPVEISFVKLLQVELDARTWTMKAAKWTTVDGVHDSDGTRLGKLEDLREHAAIAAKLHEKLALPPNLCSSWVVDGEAEICAIVSSADAWLKEYGPYLECGVQDDSPRPVSIERLRSIVAEGEAIPCNIGGASVKMTKILAQVQCWHEKYISLVSKCRQNVGGNHRSVVNISEIREAADALEGIPLALIEGVELVDLLGRIDACSDRASAAVGDKSLRRAKRVIFTVDEIADLLDEAKVLPVDMVEKIQQLEDLLDRTRAWQCRATSDMQSVTDGFALLSNAITETYGVPEAYSRVRVCSSDDSRPAQHLVETGTGGSINMRVFADRLGCEESSHSGTVSTTNSVADVDPLAHLGISECNVSALIESLCRDVKASGVATAEGEAAIKLDSIWRWCLRSLRYLDAHREVFDKRFFGAFDRFVAEGKDLERSFCACPVSVIMPNGGLNWLGAVSEQLVRLNVLLAERARYISWSQTVENSCLSENARPTIEKLHELADEGAKYPSDCELVERIVEMVAQADSWVETATSVLSQDEKPTLQEAKVLCDAGDRMFFQCPQLKFLRHGIKAARGWANRVKRCKIDKGATPQATVRALIAEHDVLVVRMPEELAKLHPATKNYCLCRRPYDGFMIGCDKCGEWYHGLCLGLSEAKAGKVDKYECIRCSLARDFENSANLLSAVVRKWTSEKELKKIRQTELQKYQRKFRKEMKEVERLQAEQDGLQVKLISLQYKESEPTLEYLVDKAMPCFAAPISLEPSISNETESQVSPVCDENVIEEDIQKSNVVVEMSEVDAKARLECVGRAICSTKNRLSELAEWSTFQQTQFDREDSSLQEIRQWCVCVRKCILSPATGEIAVRSGPMNGRISPLVRSLIDESERMGIDWCKDVNQVVNHIHSLIWNLKALSALSRQPRFDEVDELITEAGKQTCLDGKALRSLKSLAQRAAAWQAKVSNALQPCPGESKPFKLELLRSLAVVGDDIPFSMPFESRLLTVIEDNGLRHCLCGGPSDGRFMLNCDKCEIWYHGKCVNVSKDAANDLMEWTCPRCVGETPFMTSFDLEKFHGDFDVDSDSAADDDEVASKAPNAEDLWPPFGIVGSKTAIDAFGELDDWTVSDDNQGGNECKCGVELKSFAAIGLTSDSVTESTLHEDVGTTAGCIEALSPSAEIDASSSGTTLSAGRASVCGNAASRVKDDFAMPSTAIHLIELTKYETVT